MAKPKLKSRKKTNREQSTSRKSISFSQGLLVFVAVFLVVSHISDIWKTTTVGGFLQSSNSNSAWRSLEKAVADSVQQGNDSNNSEKGVGEASASSPTTVADKDPTTTDTAKQEEQHNSNTYPYRVDCTPLERRFMNKSLPDGPTIKWKSHCPIADKWLLPYLEEAVSTPTQPFTFLNLGCNKGYDSLYVAESVTRNTAIFNKDSWRNAMGPVSGAVCKQDRGGLGGPSTSSTTSSNLPIRPVEIHCVEAMPNTYGKLKNATRITRGDQHGMHVHHYAMTGTPGKTPIRFPNQNAGREDFGIHHCHKPRFANECVDVPTRTVDEFVAEHIDEKQPPNQPQRRISFMTIDVEGYDYTVIQGGMESLKRIDYLEFEYNGWDASSDWRRQKLEDCVKMLWDVGGFVCYWAGINKLWRISNNCWMEQFEFHDWSNVVCVQPKYQPKLAATMEQVFEDTLFEEMDGK